MTRSTTSCHTSIAEPDAPSLGELLVRSATGLRYRTAVQALVEEQQILARDNVRTALVTKEDGVMTCRWEGMAGRLYALGLDDGERAFLGLVLSIVGVRQSYLAAVEYLDERRLEIVLRAMTRLAGNDRIAIGTRL
ncbi:hypothetical protein F7R91_28130 [Streptomyces luteolifulvus]|uniref:Uncharacterized protein n=1 Tax=Streptomyces luteolifulvus TaxID=2615112 RepID=A0A6H9UUK0_9ACTN|nr:hypothetical protein [Streptomyces luteolifulvus]KAB1142669.1 hypothetical protein F7R91_28130 [Streptomyces luteolifulvus]